LGANAILAVSLAIARAGAAEVSILIIVVKT
jgi:enolase